LSIFGIKEFDTYFADNKALLYNILKNKKESLVFHIDSNEYYMRKLFL
jgi:hypothetical protein